MCLAYADLNVGRYTEEATIFYSPNGRNLLAIALLKRQTRIVSTYYDITDFIRPNGRLDYMRLRRFAEKESVIRFMDIFQRPLFVGSGIASGQLEGCSELGQTMLFNVESLKQVVESEMDDSLQTAIFALHKRNRGDGKPNIITVGRSNENDLVMNDYPISRDHAMIRIKAGRYFLIDNNATNGTTVNEQPLEPQKEMEITSGDKVGFGRYRFYFLDAKALYKRILAQSK